MKTLILFVTFLLFFDRAITAQIIFANSGMELSITKILETKSGIYALGNCICDGGVFFLKLDSSNISQQPILYKGIKDRRRSIIDAIDLDGENFMVSSLLGGKAIDEIIWQPEKAKSIHVQIIDKYGNELFTHIYEGLAPVGIKKMKNHVLLFIEKKERFIDEIEKLYVLKLDYEGNLISENFVTEYYGHLDIDSRNSNTSTFDAILYGRKIDRKTPTSYQIQREGLRGIHLEYTIVKFDENGNIMRTTPFIPLRLHPLQYFWHKEGFIYLYTPSRPLELKDNDWVIDIDERLYLKGYLNQIDAKTFQIVKHYEIPLDSLDNDGHHIFTHHFLGDSFILYGYHRKQEKFYIKRIDLKGKLLAYKTFEKKDFFKFPRNTTQLSENQDIKYDFLHPFALSVKENKNEILLFYHGKLKVNKNNESKTQGVISAFSIKLDVL